MLTISASQAVGTFAGTFQPEERQRVRGEEICQEIIFGNSNSLPVFFGPKDVSRKFYALLRICAFWGQISFSNFQTSNQNLPRVGFPKSVEMAPPPDSLQQFSDLSQLAKFDVCSSLPIPHTKMSCYYGAGGGGRRGERPFNFFSCHFQYFEILHPFR